MMSEPILINDHSKMEAARSASLRYLEEHEDLRSKIATHLWAYNEIGDLVPQTPDNFMSGHYFPYAESYYELENSYALCLMGFHAYAFAALRLVLELGTLGLLFAVNDLEHKEVLPWITSQERTPQFRKALDKLKGLEGFAQFDECFGLAKRVMDTYDDLSGFVHARGYRYSSIGHSRSNYNRFSEDALKRYCSAMFSVVSDMIIMMLLKYPVGMRPLPVSEKFGLRPPLGGYLEAQQVELVASIIRPQERALLKKLSDRNLTVQYVVEYFESLPDLPEDEWQRQSEEFRSIFGTPSQTETHGETSKDSVTSLTAFAQLGILVDPKTFPKPRPPIAGDGKRWPRSR